MPTRFYFDSADAAAIDLSATPNASWNINDIAFGSLKAVRTRVNSAMVNINFASSIVTDSGGVKHVVWQAISDPISAQTISGTVKGQIRCKEGNALDNFDQACMCIYVVSSDGTVVRGVLLAVGAYVAANEFTTGTAMNRMLADGDALTSVVAQDNDRIVIEVGSQASAACLGAHNITQVFGDNSATDLAEDETTTTANNPWVEFSGTILPEPTVVALESGSAASAGQDVTAVPGPLEIALEVGAGTATGNDAGTSLGAIGVELEAGGATSEGQEVSPTGGPLEIPLEAGAAVSVGYDLAFGSRFDYPNPVPTGASQVVTPAPVAFTNIGVRTTGYVLRDPNNPIYSPVGALTYYRKLGTPYFAMVTKTPGAGPSVDRATFTIDLAIFGLPMQLSDPDEHHIVVEYFVVGGPTLFYIAITPSGRLVFRTTAVTDFQSAPGLMVADGQYRTITMQLGALGASGNFYLDDTLIFNASAPYDTARFAGQASTPTAFMFFNGRTGLTRFPMGIRRAQMDALDVLRPTTPATLGDQKPNTQAQFILGSPAASGTAEVKATVIEDIGPDSIGHIPYVVFHAIAYIEMGDPIIPGGTGPFAGMVASNWPGAPNTRMSWKVGGVEGQAVLINDDPSIGAGTPAAGFVLIPFQGPMNPGDLSLAKMFLRTAKVFTQPDGTPWTMQAVNDLTDMAVRYDWSGASPDRIYANLDVQEMWMEPFFARPMAWFFNEGLGQEVHDYELVDEAWLDRDGIPAADSSYTGDYSLIAQFIDPTVYGYTRLWGSLLDSNVRSAYLWDRPTGFSKRTLSDPGYVKVSVATEFRRR